MEGTAPAAAPARSIEERLAELEARSNHTANAPAVRVVEPAMLGGALAPAPVDVDRRVMHALEGIHHAIVVEADRRRQIEEALMAFGAICVVLVGARALVRAWANG